MTFKQACECADKFYKDNGFIGIKAIEETEDVYIFFDRCFGYRFSACPFFISKNDEFEPFIQENREYEHYRRHVKPVEGLEKYRI